MVISGVPSWFDIEIVGTELTGDGWDAADTTSLIIHNYTTTENDYINIYTTASARHDGTAYKSKAYVRQVNNDTSIWMVSVYCYVFSLSVF